MEKKPITNLDKYNEDTTDIELQNRGMLERKDGGIRMTLYAWLSEERKEQNRQPLYGKYCPLEEGETVSKTYNGLKLTGKIAMLDRDYYDGDCLVLYVDLDKRSSKKFLERFEILQAAPKTS